MLKSYKFRLYPNDSQTEMLNQHFGSNRFVYNYFLNLKIRYYKYFKSNLTYIKLANHLPKLKEQHPWLKDVNSQSLQQTLKHLDIAYTTFFKNKKGFPKFKSKHNNRQSFNCPQHSQVNIKQCSLDITKIKNIKIKLHRKFNHNLIKNITISKTPTNKYYASILIDNNLELPTKPPIERPKSIGIDLGLSHYLITSDGEKINNPKHLNKYEKRLKYFNYKLSKTMKGSNNRIKCRLRLARKYEKVSNARNNFLHQTTHIVGCESQATTICVEDLNIKNMVKNHKLSKSISDASWGTFLSYLRYKCDWYGKNIITIDRFEPSSKLCNNCNYIKEDLVLKDRSWTCPQCGEIHDRDINAAKNIRDIGLRDKLGQELSEVTLVGDCGTSHVDESRKILLFKLEEAPTFM